MAEGAVVLVFLLLAVGGTVALWYAIERETTGKPKMSRADAERTVREDTDDE